MLETTTTCWNDVLLEAWGEGVSEHLGRPFDARRWLEGPPAGEAIPPDWLDSTDYLLRRGYVKA